MFLHSEIPYGTSPDWESDETGYDDYSTGGYLTDFNGDGWLDLACGNGNDMAQDENCIYFNDDGTLETIASWRSDNAEYSGHIVCGDLDKNGWTDLVVGNYIGPGWTPVEDDIYFNYNGSLETTPSWSTDSEDYTFSVTTIDYDGDGDLDIATANGERYDEHPYPVKIFQNDGGTISTTPVWQSDDDYYTYDLCAGDINNDGWLDLVGACDGEPNILFLNSGGTLSTTPDWQSTESRGSIRCVLGDVNGDGYLELAVADNEQLSSEDSKVRVYFNNGGVLENTASWVCSEEHKDYYSCVAFGDVDYDGDLDLCAGGWWEPIEVYENNSGGLETSPDWQWSTSPSSHLICEEIVLGDVDGEGLIWDTEYLDGQGDEHTYYLSHHPFEAIDSISVDGSAIPPSEYCYSPVEGWISFRNPPPEGDENIEVDYTYSGSLDLVVTNWHSTRGNFLFYNQNDISTELAYFTAQYIKGDVNLRWDMEGPHIYEGFNIYRSESNSDELIPHLNLDRIKLNDELITGEGPYSFVDEVGELNLSDIYYLEKVSKPRDEIIATTSPTLGEEIIPFELASAYPNPFSESVTVPYGIMMKGDNDIKVSIYDICGRLVKSDIYNKSAGWYNYIWDGDTDKGDEVSSGVYLCVFELDRQRYPTRIIKIK